MSVVDFAPFLRASEDFICGGSVRKLRGGVADDLKKHTVLTDRTFYRVDLKTNHVEQQMDLREIDNVELVQELNAFRMSFSKDVPQSKNAKSAQIREYQCESLDEARLWVYRLSNAIQSMWQFVFEAVVIPDPAIYQFHLFLTKQNRKGQKQVRCLLISTDSIYNLKMNDSIFVKQIQWSVPIHALKSIETSTSQTLGLRMNINKALLKGEKLIAKLKPNYTFLAPSVEHRDKLASEMAYAYHRKTNQTLVQDVTSGKL